MVPIYEKIRPGWVPVSPALLQPPDPQLGSARARFEEEVKGRELAFVLSELYTK